MFRIVFRAHTLTAARKTLGECDPTELRFQLAGMRLHALLGQAQEAIADAINSLPDDDDLDEVSECLVKSIGNLEMLGQYMDLHRDVLDEDLFVSTSRFSPAELLDLVAEYECEPDAVAG